MDTRITSPLVDNSDLAHELSQFIPDKHSTAKYIIYHHQIEGLVWDTHRLAINASETELVSQLIPDGDTARNFWLQLCNQDPITTLNHYFKVYPSAKIANQFRIVVDLIGYGNELVRLRKLKEIVFFLNAVHNSSKIDVWGIHKPFGLLRYTATNQGYYLEQQFNIKVFSNQAIAFGFTPQFIDVFNHALIAQFVKTCTVYFLKDDAVLDKLFRLALPYNYFHRQATQKISAAFIDTVFTKPKRMKRPIDELNIPKLMDVFPKEISACIAHFLTYADLLRLRLVCKSTAQAAYVALRQAHVFRYQLTLFAAPQSPSLSKCRMAAMSATQIESDNPSLNASRRG